MKNKTFNFCFRFIHLALVVATTMMGCAMAPMPFDAFTFFVTTFGTTLTSSSANSINQVSFFFWGRGEIFLIFYQENPLKNFSTEYYAGVEGITMELTMGRVSRKLF